MGRAAGISAEPLVFYPGIDLAVGHNDNLFLTEANTRSSNFWILSPWVKAEGKPGPHSFDVLFRGDFGHYISSQDDDYDDYQLLANARVVIDGRADLKLHGEAIRGHDPRGSTDRPAGNSPDEYNNTGIEGTFGYGAANAQGRVELNGGFYQRGYLNNRASTVLSDRHTDFGGATFLWRVSPRTQVLVQGERRFIDYDSFASTLDSREDRVYVGVRWEATALTSGTAKVGHLKKEFDSAARPAFSGASWELAMRWSPLTYSTFDLNTSRQTNESTGVGDALFTTLYGAAWNHAWSGRVSSQLIANWRDDEFKGVGVTREDQTKTYGARLNYEFRRWLQFGAEYTRSDRDSNVPGLDYGRNLLMFTLRATL